MECATFTQWTRHQATLQQNASSFVMVCFRCGIELPLMTPLNSIVLTKAENLFLGDDPRAKDCTARYRP